MRKILVLLSIIACSINCFAQEVYMDKAELDGSRFIRSKAFNMYSAWMSAAGFCLIYQRTSSGSEFWSLEVTLNEGLHTIEVGRKMLIKTDSGDIFEFENNKYIGPADYEYSVTDLGTNYYLLPSYPITEEQIVKLCSSKVTKVRFETDSGTFDRDIKSKKFKKALSEMYESIVAAKSRKNTVYDGF